VIRTPQRRLESSGMNSAIVNGPPLGRCCRTFHAAQHASRTYHSFQKCGCSNGSGAETARYSRRGSTRANGAVGEVGWIFMALSPNSRNKHSLMASQVHETLEARLSTGSVSGKHEPSSRRDPEHRASWSKSARWLSLAGVAPGLPPSRRRPRFFQCSFGLFRHGAAIISSTAWVGPPTLHRHTDLV
jgi:hypothetical protein